MDKSDYSKAIMELEGFKNLLLEHRRAIQDNGKTGDKGTYREHASVMPALLCADIKDEINKKLPAIKNYFEKVQQSTRALYPHSGARGCRNMSFDVLESILYSYQDSPASVQNAIDRINRCIGVYEYLEGTTILKADREPPEKIEIRRVIDLIQANLRKAFKELPDSEETLSDMIEVLLNVGKENFTRGRKEDGVEMIDAQGRFLFSKDKVSFAYSSKYYIPDFVMQELSLAIEVKLCLPQTYPAALLARIKDDIYAYRSKYAYILFLLYDAGVIRDESGFRDKIGHYDTVFLAVIKH